MPGMIYFPQLPWRILAKDGHFNFADLNKYIHTIKVAQSQYVHTQINADKYNTKHTQRNMAVPVVPDAAYFRICNFSWNVDDTKKQKIIDSVETGYT